MGKVSQTQGYWRHMVSGTGLGGQDSGLEQYVLMIEVKKVEELIQRQNK